MFIAKLERSVRGDQKSRLSRRDHGNSREVSGDKK